MRSYLAAASRLLWYCARFAGLPSASLARQILLRFQNAASKSSKINKRGQSYLLSAVLQFLRQNNSIILVKIL
jgi:hypothetical protein